MSEYEQFECYKGIYDKSGIKFEYGATHVGGEILAAILEAKEDMDKRELSNTHRYIKLTKRQIRLLMQFCAAKEFPFLLGAAEVVMGIRDPKGQILGMEIVEVPE